MQVYGHGCYNSLEQLDYVCMYLDYVFHTRIFCMPINIPRTIRYRGLHVSTLHMRTKLNKSRKPTEPV